MAKVQGTFYTAERLRRGTSPVSPPYAGDEGQPYPVNPPGSGVSTYLTLADTKDGSYVGKNGFVPVVTNEDGLTLMPIQNSEKDGLISGGVVQWTGAGYDFNVSSALARFQSVVLNSNAAVLSLTTPDATNDRIDLFILQILFDGDGIPNGMEADFITGTPAGSPVKPQIDPATQIELTQVTVTAASSTPTLTEEVIYDENIEWTGSSSGTGTVAFNSAANPFQGSLSIEATNIQNGLKIRLTDGSDYDLSGVQTLGMQLDLKAQMFAGQNIGVTFLDSTGAAISTELTLNFDKISTDYQFIGIALSQFSFTSFLARSIEFRYIRTKGATVHTGFFLDIIKLEGGINPPSVGGIPEAPNDGFAYTRKSNAWARLTPYDLDQEGATDGQVLTWVAANSRYEPVAGGGGGTIGGTIAAGQIGYASALDTLAGSNNLWWDNANTRIGIGTNAPTDSIDANGSARIRSVANATGNFATYSATGVLQQRTAAQVLSDIGASSASGTTNKITKFTGTNSLGDSGITEESSISYLYGTRTLSLTATPLKVSFGATVGNNAIGSDGNLKWKLFDDGVAANSYGIGMSGALLELRAGATGAIGFFVNNGTDALRILNTGNTQITSGRTLILEKLQNGSGGVSTEISSLSNYKVDSLVVATTTPNYFSAGGSYGTNTPGASGNLKFRLYDVGAGNANNYGIGMSSSLMEFRAGSGASMAFFPNNGVELMRLISGGFVTIGVNAAPANTRMTVRGLGTTTQTTALWEDSAGTDNVQFIDNGQVRFLRLPVAAAGLPAGSLWNNGGVINIV